MCGGISPGQLILRGKTACSLTLTFFREKLFVNMPQSDKKVLVENRNHVWRNLSRLVDSE